MNARPSVPTRPAPSGLRRLFGGIAEALVLGALIASPWAYGAIEARSLVVMAAVLAAVSLANALAGGPARPLANLLSAPSLALLGLVGLAMVQTLPVSPGLLKTLAPGTAALRAELLPPAAERVRGDDAPPVPLPPPVVSQEPEAARDMAVRLLAVWLLFQAVIGLDGPAGSFRRFGLAAAVNAAALSLFSLIQALSWNGKIYWVRPSMAGAGPFANHNHLAACLNLGLGFALGALLAPAERSVRGGERRGSRLWAAYAASLIGIGVLASLSRGGFVSMLAAAAVMVAAMRPRGGRFVALGAGLAGLTLVFLLMVGDALPYYQRLLSIVNPNGEAYADRLSIWKYALLAWKANPLLGSGLGAFATAVAPFTTRDVGTFYARAENEYLDMLVEGGLVGLALVLVVLAAFVRAARRAWAACEPGERPLLASGIFGLTAIAVQSLSDFAFHVPAVAFGAVVLCAHLWRRGGRPLPAGERSSRFGSLAAGLLLAAAAVIPVVHELPRERAERPLLEAGLSLPGNVAPALGEGQSLTADQWRARRTAYEAALKARPDWAEGYLRLGLADLYLYRHDAREWIVETRGDETLAAIFSDPLWLLAKVQLARQKGNDLAAELIEADPIKSNLAPAVRAFQQARRCALPTALAQAEMAALGFLFEGDRDAAAYAKRAYRVSGADEPLLVFNAGVALRLGELDLAVDCWRKALEVRGGAWADVADTAGLVLEPEDLLDRVVTDGRFAVYFADRLYAGDETEAARRRYMTRALELLPLDDSIPPGERLYLEARAHAGLDRRKEAVERMTAALGREPLRLDWRQQLIAWLLLWGDLKQAHDQALLGLHFNPNEPSARETLDLVNERRAQATEKE